MTFSDIKKHFKKHKKTYIVCGVAVFVVGGFGEYYECDSSVNLIAVYRNHRADWEHVPKAKKQRRSFIWRYNIALKHAIRVRLKNQRLKVS